MRLREIRDGYLCISLWIIGFVVFTAGPMFASLALSLTRYDILAPPSFIGLNNYVEMFANDELFWTSLRVTTVYTIILVPLGVICGYLISLLLNQTVLGLSFFRTVFYLPVVVPAIATSYLFAWMFHSEIGLINSFLAYFGIEGPSWFFSREWVMPAFVIMALWGLGAGMVLYLAALQGVPTALYEAAMLDGASPLAKLWHITVPMTSPVIFFTFITGLIGTFQVFTPAFVITEGGPANQSLFYILYLYRKGWQYLEMGYASAMAWVLFAIIFGLTLLSFRLAARRVYYEGLTR